MNEQEIEQLKEARCRGRVIHVPTGRGVTHIQSLTVEPGDVAYLAGDPQGDYVALYNCALTDFLSVWDLEAAKRMANAEEAKRQAFRDGVFHGETSVLVDLWKQSDKKEVISTLFRKAAELAAKLQGDDSVRASQLKAYSEGMRHCLNIMDNLGPALEAYDNIINPGVHLDIDAEDIKRLGHRSGH